MEYSDFRKMYEEQNPASVPIEETYIGEYPKWVTWAVGAMFVAAAFFSGIHTVPVAYRTIERLGVAEGLRQAGGISAFLFIELAVLLSAYMLVKRRSAVMLVILTIAITVAMGANLYSVSEALLLDQSDVFSRVIAVMFGLVAPLMAALAGGVFVWLHHADRVAEARAKAAFKELGIAWDKEIKRAYNKLYPMSKLPVQSVSVGQSVASSIGHMKVIDATVRVEQHLDAHPEDLNLSPRALALKLGVGKSTVNNVQRMRKGQGGYTNGQGEQIQ
jgi:hypothetical protein